jgi:hypothetical protein
VGISEQRGAASPGQGGDDEKALAIEKEDELVGLIQYHEENEPDFSHARLISS